MREDKGSLPLNAIRVFVMIARESHVTRAAQALGITQSAASRHLSVLEQYLGAKLIERRHGQTVITDFGRLFSEAVSEPLDAIGFAVQRMRRNRFDEDRLIVRTSLPTFAYSTLIPNLEDFTREANGAVVDVITSLPRRPQGPTISTYLLQETSTSWSPPIIGICSKSIWSASDWLHSSPAEGSRSSARDQSSRRPRGPTSCRDG